MLTDVLITKTKPEPTREVRLNDSQGLHLVVLPTGRRYWRWDYTFNGRRKQPLVDPDVDLARTARGTRDWIEPLRE